MHEIDWTVFALVLSVALPLVPAVIIYKLFPDTQVAAKGPLSGLTLKTSGAFAAYLIVFLGAIPFDNRVFDLIAEQTSPSWTIDGRIQLVDASGKDITGARLGDQMVGVVTTPQYFQSVRDRVTVTVVAQNNRIPIITYSVPQLGSTVVDLSHPDGLKLTRDEQRRTISIDSPIPILVAAQTPYQAGGLLPAADPVSAQAAPVVKPAYGAITPAATGGAP
ncbi:MAG: hypothetical protein P4L83_20885 [Nevskia sp.]|nr:hypothetical protein [Nevskia sp.]